MRAMLASKSIWSNKIYIRCIFILRILNILRWRDKLRLTTQRSAFIFFTSYSECVHPPTNAMVCIYT